MIFIVRSLGRAAGPARGWAELGGRRGAWARPRLTVFGEWGVRGAAGGVTFFFLVEFMRVRVSVHVR